MQNQVELIVVFIEVSARLPNATPEEKCSAASKCSADLFSRTSNKYSFIYLPNEVGYFVILGVRILVFKFPKPPNTLVTLQIECVSCKETFPLAEGEAKAVLSQNSGNDSSLTTSRQQPLTRALTNTQEVNCPRCDTDNRNWVRLVYADHPGGFLERQLSRLEKFSLIWVGYAVTAYLFFRLLSRTLGDTHWDAYALTFIMILLAGAIPSRAITGFWRKTRDHKIKNNYDSSRTPIQRLSPGTSQGFFYLIFFVIAIPAVFYVIIPQTISLLKPPEADLGTKINQLVVDLNPSKLDALYAESPQSFIPLDVALLNLRSNLNDHMLQCNPESINSMIQELELLKQQDPRLETAVIADNAIFSLSQLKPPENGDSCEQSLLANTLLATTNPTDSIPYAEKIKSILPAASMLITENQDASLHASIGSQVKIIRGLVDKANGITPEPSTFSILSIWIKYVGLSCLVSVITGVVATNNYINKINPHLPNPLCHNIRNLTRVVISETKQSLKINGNFRRVEWTEATQNKYGGISLKGILCPPTNGESSDKYVRGMSYVVVSDMWGRVKSAISKSVRIAPSVHQAWDNLDSNTEMSINQLFAQHNSE